MQHFRCSSKFQPQCILPLLPFTVGLTKSLSFRVTANVINVNEVYEMHIIPVYRRLFPRSLYYPIMNTVPRVITTNASASWNKRHFFHSDVHIMPYISRTYCGIFFITLHNTARFSQERLSVRDETWSYSQSVPSLT